MISEFRLSNKFSVGDEITLSFRAGKIRTKAALALAGNTFAAGNDGIYTDDPSQDKEGSAVERYLKVREENPDSTDLIMKTMGLSPLGPFNSVCGQNQTVTEHSAVEQQHHQ